LIYLLIAILLNVFLGLSFKLWPRFGIHVLPAIIHNYIACFVVGILFGGVSFHDLASTGSEIVVSGVLLGSFFIIGFTLFAISVNIWGMGIMTAVQKMSLAGSVIFTILYFGVNLDIFMISGIILGIVAIFMLLRKNSNLNNLKYYPLGLRDYLLVLGVFLTALSIEIGLMIVEKELSSSSGDPVFLVILFGSAGIWGTIYLLFRQKNIRSLIDIKHVTAGWILGIPNYFSIYALMRAIGTDEVQVSIIIPSINTGTILFAVLAGVLIFRENVSKINAWGIILAMVALYLLTFGP
jgi:hypothetical protein